METKHLRIRDISKEDNDILNIISKNMGITKGAFLKPKIRAFVKNMPDYLKIENNAQFNREVRITGVSNNLINELECISRNLGVSPSLLMRIEIKKIIDETPKGLKIN